MIAGGLAGTGEAGAEDYTRALFSCGGLCRAILSSLGRSRGCWSLTRGGCGEEVGVVARQRKGLLGRGFVVLLRRGGGGVEVLIAGWAGAELIRGIADVLAEAGGAEG